MNMTSLLFVLKQSNIALARDEVLALTRAKKHRLYDQYLVVGSRRSTVGSQSSAVCRLPSTVNRLAQSRSVHNVFFICPRNKLLDHVKKADWMSVYEKDFYVQTHGVESSQTRVLAQLIGSHLKNPVANMKNPTTRIDFFFTTDVVICALNRIDIEQSFGERKPHLRAEQHPSSMDPSLARTLVNLTGIRHTSTVHRQPSTVNRPPSTVNRQPLFVDPLCGAGGILLEAGLMGLKVQGYDNDPVMIRRAQANLNEHKIKGDLICTNALALKKKISYLATDVPYGRSTKKIDKKVFYQEFLSMVDRNLTKRAVIVFPHYVKYDDMIKKTTLNKVAEYSWYVHKTLTRKIVVVSR